MSKTFLRIFYLLLVMVSANACEKKSDGDTAPKTSEKNDSSSQSGSEEILVGAVLSLSGGQASFGTNTKKGIDLAIEQYNAKGGLLGKKIRLIALDNQSRPDEAATAITRLISQDKVDIVIGDVASSISLAMAPIAQSHQVPFVTPSSTNPRVTAVGDYIFRTCFIDPFQGTVMAKFARETLKANKVAVLRDVKNDYSVGLADYFTKTFTELGGTVIVDQSYSEGDVDFKSQLTAIKSQNPDAIFVPGYYSEVGLIARQAKEVGITAPLLGGDGWDSSKLVEIGGDAIEGNYFSNHYSVENPTSESEKFITAYKNKYGQIPDGLAVMGYDAMNMIADSIGRSKTLDKKAVRDALASTKDFPGASGTFSIDENRNAIKSAVILKVQSGKFAFVEQINP